LKHQNEEGKGLGLKNVEERLHLYFENRARFVVESEINKGTSVLLEWPARDVCNR